MIVLPQMVEVSWLRNNIKHFTNKGFTFTKKGDSFQVYALDLMESSMAKIEIICDYCNEIIFRPYCQYLRAVRESVVKKDCCKKCRGLKTSEGKIKYTIEDVKNFINDSEFKLHSNYYKDTKSKLELSCINGHYFTTTYDALINRKNGCPDCSKVIVGLKGRLKYDDVKNYIESKNHKLISEEYLGNNKKLEILCPSEHIFNMTYDNFKNDHRCRECNKVIMANKKRKYTIEFVRETFANKGCLLLEDEYKRNNIKLKFICLKHPETIQEATFHYFYIENQKSCKSCVEENRPRGENHFSWNKDLTDDERVNRRTYTEYHIWLKDVYKRDSYTCQCCGDNKGNNLNAHHLDGYHWCDERRVDVSNGITLCERCHVLDEDSFHKVYGRKNNTEAQFWEWIENKIYKHIEDNKLVSSFLCAENKEAIINVSV